MSVSFRISTVYSYKCSESQKVCYEYNPPNPFYLRGVYCRKSHKKNETICRISDKVDDIEWMCKIVQKDREQLLRCEPNKNFRTFFTKRLITPYEARPTKIPKSDHFKMRG